MKTKIRGSASLLLATIIWGFAFIAQSVGMDLIGPFTFQMVRCLLAVIFLVVCSFVMELGQGSLARSLEKWKDPALWKTGLICGGALFVAASLQQVGLVYTDAGKAGFITAMYIVLVPILGLFLGQKVPKAAFISVGLAVAGLYLLSCMGAGQINRGDLLLMGCALAFCFHILVIDHISGTVDAVRLSAMQFFVCGMLSLVCMVIWEQPSWDNLLACWLPIAYAGILSSGLGYTLQIIGQAYTEPTVASLLMSLESVFSVVFGWIILRSALSPAELVGCCLVFAGVIISQFPGKAPVPNPQKSH